MSQYFKAKSLLSLVEEGEVEMIVLVCRWLEKDRRREWRVLLIEGARGPYRRGRHSSMSFRFKLERKSDVSRIREEPWTDCVKGIKTV